MPGAPGISRSVKAATVSASSSLRNAPWPGPWACAAGAAGSVAAGCACWASAPGTRFWPATAPAPTAAPIRNARRASSCLLMLLLLPLRFELSLFERFIRSVTAGAADSVRSLPRWRGRVGEGGTSRALFVCPLHSRCFASAFWRQQRRPEAAYALPASGGGDPVAPAFTSSSAESERLNPVRVADDEVVPV